MRQQIRKLQQRFLRLVGSSPLFHSSCAFVRFMANLLAQKLQESEAITSIRDWIAPFRNDFEAFACSRRLMPLPVKVPSEGKLV